MAKAVELAGEVRSLGADLLVALQSGDAEALAAIHARHALDGARGAVDVLRSERDEARHVRDGLQQTVEGLTQRKAFMDEREDRSATEEAVVGLRVASTALRAVAGVAEGVAAVVQQVPEFTVGGAGLTGSPLTVVSTGGSKVAGGLEKGAVALNFLADGTEGTADLLAAVAEWERRAEEWGQDKQQVVFELAAANADLAAAEVALSRAEAALEGASGDIDAAREVAEHLQARFTDAELFEWYASRLSGHYHGLHRIGLNLARRAEQAYRFELGRDERFLTGAGFDSARKGLLAGEQLLVDLRRMEAAHLQHHRVGPEVTIAVSMAELDPAARALIRTDSVELDLPERVFDRRHPGLYRRRIRRVGLSVLGQGGQELPVPAKVVYLAGRTRISGDAGRSYSSTDDTDPRFVTDRVSRSVVTSGRPDDDGRFGPTDGDDRYGVFEGLGAIDSRWRIDLFADTGVDLGQVTDIVLRIDYTAVDGGALLRAAAVAELD